MPESAHPPGRWRGPSPDALPKHIRRIASHLTRKMARLYAALAAFAIMAAASLGADSAVGQVLLVLVGILVSVVVLPDTPHRLWNVDAKAMAATVPSSQLLKASHELALAVALQADGPVSNGLVSTLWDDRLDSLRSILFDPTRVVTSMSYHVQVKLREGGPPWATTVESATRCVPSAKVRPVWFSYCSSKMALDGEYLEQTAGCIGRELIDLRPGEVLDDWEKRVRGYKAYFSVEGKPLEAVDIEVRRGPDWRIVRILFDTPDLATGFLQTTLNTHFELNDDEALFPVKFSSYFIVGRTEIVFTIFDVDAKVAIDQYLGLVAEVSPHQVETGLDQQTYYFRTGRDAVLQPGAGVVFSWREASDYSRLKPANGGC